jgi:hypothetical protein
MLCAQIAPYAILACTALSGPSQTLLQLMFYKHSMPTYVAHTIPAKMVPQPSPVDGMHAYLLGTAVGVNCLIPTTLTTCPSAAVPIRRPVLVSPRACWAEHTRINTASPESNYDAASHSIPCVSALHDHRLLQDTCQNAPAHVRQCPAPAHVLSQQRWDS